jgi:hypothetical protein
MNSFLFDTAFYKKKKKKKKKLFTLFNTFLNNVLVLTIFSTCICFNYLFLRRFDGRFLFK